MTKNQITKYITTFAIIGALSLAAVAGVITASARGMQSFGNNPEVQKALPKIDRPAEPTEQLQARYDEQVAKFKKDGSLTEIGGKGHRGDKGGRGENNHRKGENVDYV